MNNRKYLLIGFGLAVLLQLIVPASMIFSSEETLIQGTEFKFKTAPVDPTDPFRGKYVTLNFDANSIEVDSTADWKIGDEVYVKISNDEDGFAKIDSISKSAFAQDQHYVPVTIQRRYKDKVVIGYPFNRYYMEESKAGPAEKAYRQAVQHTYSGAYALVSVYKGNAIIRDVMIDGFPLKELAEMWLIEEAAKAAEEESDN